MWTIVNCVWSEDDKFWDCTAEKDGRQVRALFYCGRFSSIKVGDKVKLKGE